MNQALTPCSSTPLCPTKSHDHHQEVVPPPEAEQQVEPRPLKTKRLKEYTVQSQCSTLPNNTYLNFERFTRVVEDIGLMEVELSGVAGSHLALREDVEALVSVYNQKEAWYQEESDGARKRLSQVRYEVRKVEATSRLLLEDLRGVDAGLDGVSGKQRQRQRQLSALRKELSAELRWLQEVVSSVLPEGARCTRHSNGVKEEVEQARSPTLP